LVHDHWTVNTPSTRVCTVYSSTREYSLVHNHWTVNTHSTRVYTVQLESTHWGMIIEQWTPPQLGCIQFYKEELTGSWSLNSEHPLYQGVYSSTREYSLGHDHWTVNTLSTRVYTALQGRAHWFMIIEQWTTPLSGCIQLYKEELTGSWYWTLNISLCICVTVIDVIL